MTRMLKSIKRMAIATLALAATHVLFAAGIQELRAETVLKFWHGEPAEVTLMGKSMMDPYNGGALKFKEVMERETGGQIKVEIYSSGQLFSGEREAIEALQAGALDGMITATAPLSAWEPAIGVLDLPFMFSGIDQARRVLDGPIGQDLMVRLEKYDIKGLALADNTFRQLETRNKVVASVEDLKGMKIRVMQSRVFVDMFRALDANPTPLPSAEVYSGLQTGVLDGYEHPIFAFIANRNYEVAKYVTWTNHTLTAVAYLMSLKTFNGLSPDVQQIALKAAAEARDAHRQYVEDINKIAVELLKGEGVTFTEVDTSGFKARMDLVYASFGTDVDKDLLDRVKNAK